MSEKKISYLNRNFEDYKNSLKEFVREYYPDIADSFDDASIGSWMVDAIAAVADNLSYHIDRMYGETCIDSAQQPSSLYSIARSQGYKVPGPKGGMAECEFSCVLPANGNGPNWDYAPTILRGTKVSSRNQYFEVMEDVNFKEQFDESGMSNRSFYPAETSNGRINSYRVVKKTVVVGGESKIYKQSLNAEDIVPFMEIVIPDNEAMEVVSVIVKEGQDYTSNPYMCEFMVPEDVEYGTSAAHMQRFFEVDSLCDCKAWMDELTGGTASAGIVGNVQVAYDVNSAGEKIKAVTKGAWQTVKHKFVTEFTDKGYLKLTFGGSRTDNTYSGTSLTAQEQMTRILNNDFLGLLPKAGSSASTLYVLYRAGGGAKSNVAKGAINTISYLNYSEGSTSDARVRNSIEVINTTPSVSGRDALTVDELRNAIKYYNGAQNRCVTLKDYEERIMRMPARYGCPFRIRAVEENNKVVIYTIGVDGDGHLTGQLPVMLRNNITAYLEHYRSINDYVQIVPGKVVNLKISVDAYIDKNYTTSDVVRAIRDVITSYFDINKMDIGQTIFVGDIEREIGNVDGVLSVTDITVSNPSNNTTMPLTKDDNDENIIDLELTDYLLVSDNDSIFEIKNPTVGGDIIIRTKTR